MIVLQEPIKNEFGLSDLQLGLMNAFYYTDLFGVKSDRQATKSSLCGL